MGFWMRLLWMRLQWMRLQWMRLQWMRLRVGLWMAWAEGLKGGLAVAPAG